MLLKEGSSKDQAPSPNVTKPRCPRVGDVGGARPRAIMDQVSATKATLVASPGGHLGCQIGTKKASEGAEMHQTEARERAKE